MSMTELDELRAEKRLLRSRLADTHAQLAHADARADAAEAQLVEERAHFSAIHEVDLARASTAEAEVAHLTEFGIDMAVYEQVVARAEAAEERERSLATAVADTVWKATQYGTTEDGDTFAYIVPKGTMHRLVGVAQSNGAQVSVSFRNESAASLPVEPAAEEPEPDPTRLIDPELAHGRESSEKEMRELRAHLAAERDLP